MTQQVGNALAVKMEEPSVGVMLQGMLQSTKESGITPEHVSVLKGMMDLYERNADREAQREFAQAFAALQAETGKIAATKMVDRRSDGTCRYKFAAYEDIMTQCKPVLAKHGFSISFDTETGADRLTSICTLMHSGGHSKSNRFAVRYTKPPGSSESQGDMSTKSYAKRGALCDALNIVIEHDDDAQAVGETINKEEAADLRRTVEKLRIDESAFLKFAGATTFEEIPVKRLTSLLLKLDQKAKKNEVIKEVTQEVAEERNADGTFVF